MNNFTKEELVELESSLIFKMDRFLPTPEKRTHDLVDKIQSLIDNYCIHQDQVAIADENGHMVVQCGRCDTILWHEKD